MIRSINRQGAKQVGIFIWALTLSNVLAAQSYENIQWVTFEDSAGFSYELPSEWLIVESPEFVIITTTDDAEAYCSIKRTADWSFEFTDAETYVQVRLEQRDDFEALLPLQYSGGSEQVLMYRAFPYADKAGLLSVTQGVLDGEKVSNAVFQTIADGASFTVSCFTSPEKFGYYFPTFTQIPDRFTFAN